jgi:peptidoglycan hydrolase-like protein with peptidoglycan-binding domain
MRTGRYLAFASVLAALAVAGPASAVLTPYVAAGQVALRAHGLYRGAVDGIQGPQTNRAIRTFQRGHGLAVDGVVGPRTRAKLGKLGRPLFGKRMIRRGMVGWDVSVLQFLLGRRGARPRGVDGVFGRNTLTAVQRFQSRRGLVVDGLVGPATRQALKSKAHARGGLKPARARGPSPAKVHKMLGRWARYYGISPRLVRAVAWMESGFRWNVTSSAGAWGVMQVMPATWRFVEDVLMGRNMRHTARGNIRVGIVYLRYLLRLFGGNRRVALGAYYQGPRAVRRHGFYAETRVYVRTVLALRRRF